jgi:hypothetical protein
MISRSISQALATGAPKKTGNGQRVSS